MTVEMVVALPVLLAVAVVAVNAMLFLGDCAAFDRQARLSICAHAASPGYGQTAVSAAAVVQSELSGSFSAPYEQVSVESSGQAWGYVRYTARLRFTPTLFGHSLSGNVFGVALPALTHETYLTVDPYKPGVIK